MQQSDYIDNINKAIVSLESTYLILQDISAQGRIYPTKEEVAFTKLSLLTSMSYIGQTTNGICPSLESDITPSMESLLGEIGGAISSGIKIAYKSIIKMIMEAVELIKKGFSYIGQKISDLKKSISLLTAKRDQYVKVKLPKINGYNFTDKRSIIIFYKELNSLITRVINTEFDSLETINIPEYFAHVDTVNNKDMRKPTVLDFTFKSIDVIDIVNTVMEVSNLIISKEFISYRDKLMNEYKKSSGDGHFQKYVNNMRRIPTLFKTAKRLVDTFAIASIKEQASMVYVYQQSLSNSGEDHRTLNGVATLTEEQSKHATSLLYDFDGKGEKEVGTVRLDFEKRKGLTYIRLLIRPLDTVTKERVKDEVNRISPVLIFVETELNVREWFSRINIKEVVRPVFNSIEERFGVKEILDEENLNDLKNILTKF